MAMLSSGRTGFRREFLEINGIERHYITHAVRASPTNEGILLANSKVPKCVYPTCHLGRQKSLENVHKKKYC